MEVKKWSYEEFPEFLEEVEGVSRLNTSGEEVGVHYEHDVEYANMNGVPLHLQILTPFSRNNQMQFLPCVIFVQGSAWMKQDVYINLPMISKMAEYGYVVAVVEYRHSGIAPFPAQAIDVRNAIRFMKVNAEKYNINPRKMIVAGDSSGGHTAMFAGILHDDETENNLFPGTSAEVSGIINLYGSVSVMMEDGNPSTINHHLPDSPEGMEMGGVNLREHPELCKKLSVECNIDESTDIARVLMFHGTKDRIVNTRQSVNLYRCLKELDKDVALYLIEGADHGGAEFWTSQTMSIMDEFIKRVIADTK